MNSGVTLQTGAGDLTRALVEGLTFPSDSGTRL